MAGLPQWLYSEQKTNHLIRSSLHSLTWAQSDIVSYNTDVFETQIKHRDTFDVSQRIFLTLTHSKISFLILWLNRSLHFSNKPFFSLPSQIKYCIGLWTRASAISGNVTQWQLSAAVATALTILPKHKSLYRSADNSASTDSSVMNTWLSIIIKLITFHWQKSHKINRSFSL